MATELLNQSELASRWRVSQRTLEAYRWRGEGPAYLKIRGRVLYRLADIQGYEDAQRVDPNAVSSHSPTGTQRNCPLDAIGSGSTR
jgi:hypothetical protein